MNPRTIVGSLRWSVTREQGSKLNARVTILRLKIIATSCFIKNVVSFDCRAKVIG